MTDLQGPDRDRLTVRSAATACDSARRVARPRPAGSDDARGEARPDRRLLGEGGRRGRRAAAGRVRRRAGLEDVHPARTRSPHPAYGTRPVEPASARGWLWAFQRDLVTETRLGIPAIVHEECLTGLSAWKAATFPTPLAWGASFDPDLVDRDGRGDRLLDARARHPPGAGPRARRDPRPALGPGRGVHRRGPVPRRHHRHVVRARAAVAAACTPPSSTSSATPRRRPGATSRPVHAGPARAGRRAAHAVRDGRPGRRRPRRS